MSRLDAILEAIDRTRDASMQRWFELLRIPSVSADPAHAADCRRAAEFMAELLSGMGLDASVRDTPGHPMVVAHMNGGGPAAPRVLFYGHYDVQPVDPLEEWRTDPFEPALVVGEDGRERVFARGACDDKGQLMTFVEALVVTGPRVDLHSGLYGGPVHNPNHVVARLIAGLWDGKGRVTLEGFYDGVRELPEETRRAWAALGLDDEALLAEVGLVPPAAGEEGYTALEKIWARPTLEVNGMSGGYTGPGAKTVIPREAFFKISCRLVDDQDPFAIRDAFRRYVRENLPAGMEVRFAEEGGASPAVRVPEDLPAVRAAARCLADEWGREPVMMGCGGSIPVVRSFKDILDMDSLLVGFGLPDDAIHSPNEKYDVRSFHKGIRSWARIIDALGSEA